MFPIPFMTMLAQQQEAEDRFAGSPSSRPDGRLLEAAITPTWRGYLDGLFRRFQHASARQWMEDCQMDDCGRTASCSECG